MTPPTHRAAPLGLQAWVGREGKTTAPAPEYLKPVVGDAEWPRAKPLHGFWTSTYHGQHGSGWCQWCLSEEFEVERSDPTFRVWTLEPDPEARIYTIDKHADLKRLCQLYGRTRTWGEDSPYGPYHDTYPDWSLVAEFYDGVHMTEKGQGETRLTRPLNLYGWDCECTLWFRWKFTAVADLGSVRVEPDNAWWGEMADAT